MIHSVGPEHQREQEECGRHAGLQKNVNKQRRHLTIRGFLELLYFVKEQWRVLWAAFLAEG